MRSARFQPAPFILPALLLAVALFVPKHAGASYFDTFGVDARGMALGNSMAAWTDGWASVHYNPAALALTREIEFSLGFNYATHNIKVRYESGPEERILTFPGKPGSIENIPGPTLGFLVPVQRLTPRRLPTPIAAGVGIFVPRQALSTTLVVEQVFPVDVIFTDRNTSLALDFALSTRISPALYLGVGLATQLRSGGDMRISDGESSDVYRYNVRFGTPSVLAGILVRPCERLRVGLVYRQQNSVRTSWSALVQTRIQLTSAFGPPLSLYQEKLLEKDFVTSFTPENLSLGAAYRITERFRVSAQVDWYRWSQYQGPQDRRLAYGFNDIFVPRMGVSYRPTRKLELRGGVYYEPTPVTGQADGYYPIGNDRLVPSAGLGYALDVPWNLVSKPLVLDAFIQYHVLLDRRFYRPSSGPAVRDMNLTSSGSVINLGCSITFRF